MGENNLIICIVCCLLENYPSRGYNKKDWNVLEVYV
jgi:hypothetical protein